jgi:predicted RNA-binding protein with PUA-like domain
MAYWLMKSEPTTFSIDDLKHCKKPEGWDGVRNYQARNMMRDQMQKGDLAFFYHSNCEQPAVVGIMEVAHEAIPDHTAFDAKDSHYDPKSDPEAPRWWMVGVRFKEKFKYPVTLHTIKQTPSLEDMALVKRGNRLSIMPVTRSQWQRIVDMATAPT